MKALVGAFNQEKALVEAFSVIVKTGCGTDGSICGTSCNICPFHIHSAVDNLILRLHPKIERTTFAKLRTSEGLHFVVKRTFTACFQGEVHTVHHRSANTHTEEN